MGSEMCIRDRYNLNGHSRLASYNKTKKCVIFWACRFSPRKKMCAFQRSSEHVVIRRVAQLSRIGARLMYGTTYGTPRRPHGPSGAPSGPDRPPADRRRHRRTPFNRRLPGLGGPQLLLAQPRLLLWSRQLQRRTLRLSKEERRTDLVLSSVCAGYGILIDT